MGKQRIICVDDETTILRSLREQLEIGLDEEYRVEIAQDGNEALLLLEELFLRKQEVPLIIADYIMPEMKGDELLKKVREKHPDTVSILLTGHASLQGIKSAVNEAGVFRYISKPWNKELLFSYVREALEKYSSEKSQKLKSSDLSSRNKYLSSTIEKSEKEITSLKEMYQTVDSNIALSVLEDIEKEFSQSLSFIKTGLEKMVPPLEYNDLHNLEVARTNNVGTFFKSASQMLHNLLNTFEQSFLKLAIPAENHELIDTMENIIAMRSMLSYNSANGGNYLDKDYFNDSPAKSRLERVVAWDEEDILLFNASEVLFFSTESKNTIVVTVNGKYKVKDRLDELEEKYSTYNFFRCHRCFLVNLGFITKITPWLGSNSYIAKFNGLPYEIPVSRNKIKEMKRLLGITQLMHNPE
jgi:DNA-binding LytR/AlgR family response regulator